MSNSEENKKEEIKQASEQNKSEKEKLKEILGGFAVLGGIALFMTFFYFIGGGADSSSSNSSSGPDKFDAEVMAEGFVKDNLKSPSTAKFPITREKHIEEVKENEWKVESWVESENSFGATVRSDFTVVMEYDPSDEGWTLLDISIN